MEGELEGFYCLLGWGFLLFCAVLQHPAVPQLLRVVST